MNKYDRPIQKARRASERERSNELLSQLILLVNSSMDFSESIAKLLEALRDLTRCDAVGIRLREGDDFPYFETRGFPREFVEAERKLCSYDAFGRVQRDSVGNPVLECMCGNVLQGRFDPSKPFFTEHGSFWTNGTTALLASTTEADRQARTRNRCNGEGYESVALIPLKLGGSIYGLLQFNSRREERYSARLIARLEDLAGGLAMAIAGREAVAALRKSEELYRSLFENMLNGFAYCRMIYEGGEPSDFLYIAVNQAFERQTGLVGAAGRRASELIPGLRESDRELIHRYGRVASTGQSERFEYYVQAMGMWFEVSVFRPSPEHFVAVFDVITERKLEEERTKKSLDEKEALLRELHHRVKNNLNVVASLLDLQLLSIQEPERAIDALSNSRNRVIAMAMIHEELYNAGGYGRVDMSSYLRRLTSELQDAFSPLQEIILETRAESLELDIDRAIPCGLITNELITNAFKHAFPRGTGGKIDVILRKTSEDRAELLVADDGVGPMSPKKEATLGLSLVRLLAEQLGGELEIAGTRGMSVRVGFPCY
jgi:Signal transduction histidine kinase